MWSSVLSIHQPPNSQSQKFHISNILQSYLGMDQHLSKTPAMWFGQVLIPPVWQSHNADAAAGHQRCHKTKSRLAKSVARRVQEPGTNEKCEQNVLIAHDYRTNSAKYSETSRTGPPVVRIQITLPNPTNATKQWRTDYSFLMARLHLDEEKHCFVNPWDFPNPIQAQLPQLWPWSLPMCDLEAKHFFRRPSHVNGKEDDKFNNCLAAGQRAQ